MEPQRPGSGQGAYNGYDGWGRPQGAPQQPGPEATYEVPWEFDNAGNAGAAQSGANAGASRPGAGYGQRVASQQGWTNAAGSSSPVPGMSAKDFQKMCRSVDKAFSQFARAVNKGVDTAATAMGTSVQENLEAYQRMYQKRQGAATARAQEREQQALVKGRFRSSWGLTASGVAMTAAGGLGLLYFGTLTLVGVAMGLAAGAAGVATAATFGVATAGAGVLLGFGVRRLVTASRYKAFKSIFGTREVVTFDELGARSHMTPKAALSAAQRMLKQRLLPQGRIDEEQTCLMVTDGAWGQYRQLRAYNQQIQTEQQRQAAEQAAKDAEAARQQQVQAAAQDARAALPPEARAIIESGEAYVAQLRALDERIDDAPVSAKIVAIEEVVGRILARVEAEPRVAAGLTRMTDYYLPTTAKLLAAYADLEDQPVQGDNIASSRKEIEQTLDVLTSAYEKLLDDTFQELTMDVSADISVLHAVLAQEGLVDGPFDVNP